MRRVAPSRALVSKISNEALSFIDSEVEKSRQDRVAFLDGKHMTEQDAIALWLRSGGNSSFVTREYVAKPRFTDEEIVASLDERDEFLNMNFKDKTVAIANASEERRRGEPHVTIH